MIESTEIPDAQPVKPEQPEQPEPNVLLSDIEKPLESESPLESEKPLESSESSESPKKPTDKPSTSPVGWTSYPDDPVRIEKTADGWTATILEHPISITALTIQDAAEALDEAIENWMADDESRIAMFADWFIRHEAALRAMLKRGMPRPTGFKRRFQHSSRIRRTPKSGK